MEEKKPPGSLSPRQLRRTKTVDELEMEKSIVKIRRIKSSSEGLSRHRRPERKAKHLLNDLKAVPRPRSPSMTAAYLDALDNIKTHTSGSEKQISRLAERPDLSGAIDEALESGELAPLLNWPERLWTRRAYRRLIIDPSTKDLREEFPLAVALLAGWMKESSTSETYFREDTGGGRQMLKFLIDELDSWIPNPDQDLFKQCIIHCIKLPYSLSRILLSLRRAVKDLPADILLSSLLLTSYLPRAMKAGCKPDDMRMAMRQCFSPPKEMGWMVERALASLSPKKATQLVRRSVEI